MSSAALSANSAWRALVCTLRMAFKFCRAGFAGFARVVFFGFQIVFCADAGLFNAAVKQRNAELGAKVFVYFFRLPLIGAPWA